MFVPWGQDGDPGAQGDRGEIGPMGLQGNPGLDGPAGVGIERIEVDEPNPQPGQQVTVSVHLSNGDIPTFHVPPGGMGLQGEQGEQGPGGIFVSDVDVIGPVGQSDAGNTYRFEVTLTDPTTGGSSTVTTPDTFLAPRGPAGMGSGGNISLDAGEGVQIVENGDQYTISSAGTGNAVEILGQTLPAIPVGNVAILLEYIPGTGFQWVQVPTGVVIDTALSLTSTNAVENRVVTAGLNAKQDTLTFDSTPTAGSSNPVTSQGIDAALDLKLTITDIDNLVEHSNNGAVPADNIADVFDHTVFDSDLVTDANGLVTGIQTGGTFIHQPDGSGNMEYLRTGGTTVTLAGEDNVQADYTETDTNADSFILNKPVLTTINGVSDPQAPKDWTIQTGDVTSVDNTNRVITLGASSGPTPHARLSASFALAPTSSIEGSFQRVTGTARASVVSPQSGDVVSNVEFVSDSLTSSLRTINPGAAGTTSTSFTFDVQPGDTAQVITFAGMYRVTATINGDTSTTTHAFNAQYTLAPSWGALVATSVPSTFSNSQGAFAVGDMVTVTGVPNGIIYVWVPTSATDPFFTTDNPNIYYQATDVGVTDGDHELFSLGMATAGTYIVRVGGVKCPILDYNVATVTSAYVG